MADEKKASAKPEKSSKPAKKSDAKADKSKAKKAKKNPFKSIGSSVSYTHLTLPTN